MDVEPPPIATAPAPPIEAPPAGEPAPPPVPPARPRPARAPAAAKHPTHSIAEKEFPDLVQALYERKWTGLLVFNHMAVEKLVSVQNGHLVFASSSNRDDRLGEVLMRTGRITLKQFMDASRKIKQGTRLGAILVDDGVLDPKELVKVVVEHTQEIIYGLFLWTEGMYQLHDGVSSAEAITLKLSTPNIILEGIRRIDSWTRIEWALGGVEARYERPANYRQEMGDMNLSPQQLAILRMLEQPRAVFEVCEQSALPTFDVCRTLWALRVVGAIRKVEG
jgi:hypothetical protein